jgi:muramidase (phage lysozyme)
VIPRSEIRDALGNRNVQAMLSVLRSGLGTDGANGYRTLFGGEHFEDVSWHPTKPTVAIVDSRHVVSSSAGAYGIEARVWEGLVDRYDFEDFGPTCQDEAAVALFGINGALQDIITGNFVLAVEKIAAQWLFLPGSPYAEMDMDSAMAIYHRHGGRLEAEMPATAQPQPATPKRIRPLVIGLVVFGLITWALLAKGATWVRMIASPQ